MLQFKIAVLCQAYNISTIGSPLGINSLSNEEQFIELSRRVDDWWELESPDDQENIKDLLPYAYIYICDPMSYENNAEKFDNNIPIKWRHSEFNTEKFSKLLNHL